MSFNPQDNWQVTRAGKPHVADETAKTEELSDLLIVKQPVSSSLG